MTWKSFLVTCLLSFGLPLTILSPAGASTFIISDVSGTVESRWRFSLFWRRAARYAELNFNHRLRVSNSSSVTITCLNANGDWITWTVNVSGEVPVYENCSDSVRPDRATAPTRSPIDESLPYVVSPRNTALLPGSNAIVWNSVPDASTYQVSVHGRGAPWNSGWLTATRAQLPLNLETGRTYEITVETDKGISSNPGNSAPPTFKILTEEKARTITQQVAQIESLELDSTTQALAVAQLYQNHNLNQNAITILESQVQGGYQSAAIYQLQASLYEKIGLTNEAQQQYNNALELTDAGNLEQQAIIKEQLGLLARGSANHASAVKWLQSAETIYQQQLDTSLPEVQARLQELNMLINDSQARLPISGTVQRSITP